MTKSELKELEELLVDVEESNDKIDLIEAVYFLVFAAIPRAR